MCYQSAQAGQEEEDKEGDQDPAESVWGTKHCRAAGRGQRQPSKSILFYL